MIAPDKWKKIDEGMGHLLLIMVKKDINND